MLGRPANSDFPPASAEARMSDVTPPARPVLEVDDEPSATPSELASILALQTGLAVIAALYVAREVVVPITVAILLSFVLTPLVNLLRAAKLGPGSRGIVGGFAGAHHSACNRRRYRIAGRSACDEDPGVFKHDQSEDRQRPRGNGRSRL